MAKACLSTTFQQHPTRCRRVRPSPTSAKAHWCLTTRIWRSRTWTTRSALGYQASMMCSPKTIRDLFIWLIDRGVVLRLNAGPSKVYRLNPDYVEPTPQAGPRIQEFKPLGILDISTFQRQCEAARNEETRMV